jgi:competence ComEA-like helix-hairpin-helix protein
MKTNETQTQRPTRTTRRNSNPATQQQPRFQVPPAVSGAVRETVKTASNNPLAVALISAVLGGGGIYIATDDGPPVAYHFPTAQVQQYQPPQMMPATLMPQPPQMPPAQYSGPVNINTAPLEILATLDGVGEKTASKIIAGRPYGNAWELVRVHGIGEKLIQRNYARLTTQ